MLDFSKTKGLSRTLLGLSCVLLSSCAMDSPQELSNMESPSSYGQITNTVASNITDDNLRNTSQITNKFYNEFNDSQLSSMISLALKNNYDIRTAYINLRKAQTDLGLAQSNLHPTLNANISSNVQQDLSSSVPSERRSSANLSLSYEVDLFGRLDDAERSSYELFKATAYDYKAMQLSVIDRTSQYYWDYAFAVDALNMAKEQLEDSQKRLNLIASMRDQGIADGLEYDRALVNHRNVEQMVYQRGYELTSAHNALTTLLGMHTQEDIHNLVQDRALEKSRVPQIALNLPSTLLQERPDLMAYEAKVKSAYANVEVAEQNFYPRINLNSSIGSGSVGSLSKFFLDPVGALGAAITFPFLNYNELQLQKESSLLAKEQAKLNFANGFINAVSEVSDSINELSYQEQLLKSSKSEYELTKSNYQRYEQRYRYGSASLTELLDASDSLRSAQIKLLSAKRDLLKASMHLMIALGGGSFSEKGEDNSNQELIEDKKNPQYILQEAKHTLEA